MKVSNIVQLAFVLKSHSKQNLIYSEIAFGAYWNILSLYVHEFSYKYTTISCYTYVITISCKAYRNKELNCIEQIHPISCRTFFFINYLIFISITSFKRSRFECMKNPKISPLKRPIQLVRLEYITKNKTSTGNLH